MHVLAGVYTDPADSRALNLNAKFHFRLFGHRSLQEFVRVLNHIRIREKIAYRQPDFAIVGVSCQRLSIVQPPRTHGASFKRKFHSVLQSRKRPEDASTQAGSQCALPKLA